MSEAPEDTSVVLSDLDEAQQHTPEEQLEEARRMTRSLATALTVMVLRHGTDGRVAISDEEMNEAANYGMSFDRHPLREGIVVDVHRVPAAVDPDDGKSESVSPS